MKVRKKALRAVGNLYKRAKVDLAVCAYCGDIRYCLDHVPPLQYVAEYVDVKKFIEKGGELLLYPVCDTCNSFLGSRKLPTVGDRLNYLLKKYASLSERATWSDEELSELGKNMQAMIFHYEAKRRMYASKLKGVVDSLAVLSLKDN